MKAPFALPCLAVLLVLPGANAQSPAPTSTVDDLVAKNIQAKGGAAALEAIKTIRFEGRLLINQGQVEFKYTETKKRPGKVRADAALQGMVVVSAHNSATGWKIYPFRGRKDPEKMSTDEAKSLVEEAEIGGPLENWKAQGKTVAYLGTEDVEGTAAHKLKVTRKNGDVSYVYLDPDYFLEIRIIDHGPGMSTKDTSKLFTPFQRLGDRDNSTGVGLGLAIVKGFTELMNGRISVEETFQGGLTMVLSFPIGGEN